MDDTPTTLPLYFAYGSNLAPEEMELRARGHRVLCRAILHDHALRFHGFNKAWNGAVATIEHSPGARVYGVVHQLSPEDFARLDHAEGCYAPGHPDNRSDRVQLPVVLENGESFEVFTHILRPEPPGRPSHAYRWAMLAGMRHHGLPASAIAALEAEPTAD
jgi:hypothetical protein